jgi:hypothetical protein
MLAYHANIPTTIDEHFARFIAACMQYTADEADESLVKEISVVGKTLLIQTDHGRVYEVTVEALTQ